MIVMGIDPGYAITGYGIVEKIGNNFKLIDYGAVTTDAGVDFPKRLDILYSGLTEIINKYNPEIIGMEELFFNKNIKTAIAVGQGRGVAVLAVQRAGKPLYEYTPLQVKQAVVGYGRAEKMQVQKMVQIMLKLKAIPKPDDAADALAIAICCGNSVKNNKL